MAARSKARKRALDILFEADQRSVPALTVLARRVELAEPPVNEHTIRVVEGVVQQTDRIDGLIETYAEGWPLDRMPAVDRALLRLAVYELLYCDDVPSSVVIDEAVELAKSLSTDDSPGFVNGLLSRILSIKSSLVPTVPPVGFEPT